MSDLTNKLYFGDNLDILREHIADESVCDPQTTATMPSDIAHHHDFSLHHLC